MQQNNILQTIYKRPVGSTNLFDLTKINEYFLDQKHTCVYKLKCETGFGHTIAVALRRTILSAIEGSAVVAMKINDAPHLFASLPGVKQSVLDISLQLQKIAFKFISNEFDYCFLGLKKKATAHGATVYASDFEKNPSIAIINGDLEICRLDNNGELNLQIMIAKGVGYVPFQDHIFHPYLQEGFFAVDSFFLPGLSCGYSVENSTSGKNTMDIITLNIETDGSISPDKVLSLAGSKLTHIFKQFDQENISNKEISNEEDEMDVLLAMKVSDIDISVRAKNCLLGNMIETVGALVERTQDELSSLSGFGDRSLNEIIAFLTDHGLELGKKITKKRKI
jgi:DNA-directed RNA polymerase subunit alpha